MKILLIDFDGKIPNLALHKIAKYYEGTGAEVIWNFPLMAHKADKIFVSCIFPENKKRCLREWGGIAEIGGSGFSLKKMLPPKIEEIKPKINLGFTTRGCIRKCSFCIVPQKEGAFRVVGDLLDLWDGKSRKIILLDNNILADPLHFSKICQQAKENKIEVDFNQGLDHRLLNQEICNSLKTLPGRKRFRFSFDHPSMLPTVERAIELLNKNGIRQNTWYVLVGFNTSTEEDFSRLQFLKDAGQRVFVQKYNQIGGIYTQMARWGNQHHIFQKMTFEAFLKHRNRNNFPLLEKK